jgi:hypothetical protein
MRPLVRALIAVLLALQSVSALAQGEAAAALLPTELSVGVGGGGEWSPGRSLFALNVGLSKVWVRDQWIEPAVELGLGPTSDEAPCQDAASPLGLPETCTDYYLLTGPRFRPRRESDRRWRPFAHFLLGGYWNGSGLKEPETMDVNLALQAGGGIDLRSPRSIHGLRLAGDYRRVFAGDRGRHQTQFVVSYFVGWRGATPPVSSPPPD